MNEERERNAHKKSNVIAKVLCMQVNMMPKLILVTYHIKLPVCLLY